MKTTQRDLGLRWLALVALLFGVLLAASTALAGGADPDMGQDIRVCGQPGTQTSAQTTRWTDLFTTADPNSNSGTALPPGTQVTINGRDFWGCWVSIQSANGNGWLPVNALNTLAVLGHPILVDNGGGCVFNADGTVSCPTGAATGGTPAPAPAPAPGTGNTIVDIAAADGRFTTLLTAATEAGLAGMLSNNGPFTVFAPTDAAFAALPDGTIEALLADATALRQVLLYHIVQGAVPAATVVGLDSARTALGRDVTIAVVDGGVVLNGSVNVIITDIQASNGIIHVIDAVLIPPAGGFEAGAPAPAPTPAPEPAPTGNTIVDIAAADGRFTTLLTAATEAGLAGMLSNNGPFTVFAPTDAAFAALPDGTIEALLANPTQLRQILLYHIVQGAVPAATVVTLDSATTALGRDVTIEIVDGGVVLNGSVNVIITDIEASNGIIHVIDAVLLPPGGGY